MDSVMGDVRRNERDGLGTAWDRWVDRVNEPDEDEDDKEPWTLRRVLETAAFFAIGIAVIVVVEQFADFNWSWIPWKQLAVVGLVLAAGLRWIVHAVRSLVRRMRGRPRAEREPSKRDRLAEKLRDLDEPYLQRERSMLRD
jgi:hypothetical protein